MPSPFPGMNPFLEQDDAWHDFHERYIPRLAAALTAQVRPGYIVKIDEHVYVHEMPDGPSRLAGRADVSVGGEGPVRLGPAVGVLEAPGRVRLPELDEERLAFVEVRDRRDRTLVAVIELLSPSNKRPGADREQYLGERSRLLAAPVHLVEIDLLRGGRSLPAHDRPACDYSVLVSRADERPSAQFWPIALREPLPTVPVPLLGDDSAALDLQAALHQVYDEAGYEDYIYDGRPEPPLAPADAAWGATLTGRDPA